MLTEAALLVSLSVTHGEGTEGCVAHAQLSRAVERRLQRRVFVPREQAALFVDVAFSKRGAETEATIRLADDDGHARGTRSLLTSSHCSALDDSLALSIALLVDEPPEPQPKPEASATSPAEGSSTPGASPAAAPRAATPLAIPPEVAAPREPWHLTLGVAAAGAWGLLPQVRPALVIQAQVLPRGFVPILLQGEGFWTSTAERDPSSGARFRLLRVGLSLCPSLLVGERNSLGLCAGQKLGWLSVEGYGFDQDSADRRLSFALALGAEGRQRLWKPFSLRAYLGGEIPLVRDRFTSGGANATELYRPASVALSAEVGVEAALW